MNVFWFKRDLRLLDNQALNECLKEKSLLIYIYEPSLINDKHYSNRHFQFIKDSILDLNKQLEKYNTKILELQEEATNVFEFLIDELEINNVYSNQETGINKTYQRDKLLKKLFERKKVKWYEYPSNGISRGLKNRDIWVGYWNKIMSSNIPKTTIDPLKVMSLVSLCLTHWGVSTTLKAVS